MSLARIEQAQTLFNHITHCPDHRRQDFVGRDLSRMSLQHVLQAAEPAMRKRGGGSIINISSIFGLIGSAGSTAYHGTKGAVRLLTKAAAVQYGPEKIRVSSIHPGLIYTPMVDEE
jgi:NAD(P)-dependent dehydrogenase (short-subunit alcohol dehydrogenase family)